jgi:Zn-dependent protease
MISTVAFTALTTLLVLASVAAHEAGHYVVLHRLGIPVDQVALGLAIRPRLVFAPTERRPYEVSISPWLVSAHVRVHADHLDEAEALGYHDDAWVAGVGIVANLVFGGVALAAVNLLRGSAIGVLVGGALAVAAWYGCRLLCSYVFPVLGLGALALLVYSIVDSIGSDESAGPVGVGKLLVAHDLTQALMVATVFSLALAAINLAPVPPLDGGRTWSRIIQRLAGRAAEGWYQASGMLLMIGLLVYSIGSDLVRAVVR